MKYLSQNSLTKVLQLVKSKLDALSITRVSVSITETTSTISIPATITVTDSSRLLVYHNGVLLSVGEHYTVTDNITINLVDYNAESGDVISFVYHNM